MSKSLSNEELEKSFKEYSEKVKSLDNVNNEDKLFLYSYYKQSLFGDNINPKPSIFNRVEMEKWKSWNNLVGKDKKECMEEYIKKVKLLLMERR